VGREGPDRQDIGPDLEGLSAVGQPFQEFLEKDEAKERGEGPELRQPEGLDLLVALHEKGNLIGVEASPVPPDQFARDDLDAGVPLRCFREVSETREAPQELRGDGPVQGLQGFGDDEVVLEEPVTAPHGERGEAFRRGLVAASPEEVGEPPIHAAQPSTDRPLADRGGARYVSGSEPMAVLAGRVGQEGRSQENITSGPGEDR
jgi:hypothetical protein